MSMKQVKGKQKIEMKKVEAYGNRQATFWKRRFGIYKKMNEIVASCDVELAFLVYSEAGKPYSFANPSMEEMADRLKNLLGIGSSARDDNNNTKQLVKAYKKQKIESLMKKYVELLKELDMEKEKVKLWKESRNEKEIDQKWWVFASEDLSVERLKLRHETFVELHNHLNDISFSRLEKDIDDSSSRSPRRENCGCNEHI